MTGTSPSPAWAAARLPPEPGKEENWGGRGRGPERAGGESSRKVHQVVPGAPRVKPHSTFTGGHTPPRVCKDTVHLSFSQTNIHTPLSFSQTNTHTGNHTQPRVCKDTVHLSFSQTNTRTHTRSAVETTVRTCFGRTSKITVAEQWRCQKRKIS